jgi:predicted RNase H-like nuclease (RuvC/YqgF family)
MNHLEPPFSSNRPTGNVLRAEIERLDAEVERLQDELLEASTASREVTRLVNKCEEQREEIERLNAALDKITSYIPATIDDNDGNPRVPLFCIHKLQSIAARSNKKESN